MDRLLKAWPLALEFRLGEESWDQMSGLIERQLAVDALELMILQAITGSRSKINASINLNKELRIYREISAVWRPEVTEMKISRSASPRNTVPIVTRHLGNGLVNYATSTWVVAVYGKLSRTIGFQGWSSRWLIDKQARSSFDPFESRLGDAELKRSR